MKVLMFGWEFPPHISGGLGTACYGLSRGLSTIDEIAYAVDFLRSKGKNEIVLMYGFQTYPTNYADINLSKMLKIRDIFNLPVGYADHTAFDDPNNEIISAFCFFLLAIILK